MRFLSSSLARGVVRPALMLGVAGVLAAPLAQAQTAAPSDKAAQSVAAPARASGLAALKGFLAQVQSGRSSFTQTVLGAGDKPSSTVQGEFSFARPNQFRFEYQKPYRQSIVSDGKTLWFFDADLDQVTRRDAREALATTPVAVLSSGSDLEKAFVLTEQPARDGQVWVQATPRQEGSSVKALRLGFKDKLLATLEIDDALGQKSVVRFGNFQANAKVGGDAFRFIPPAGVQVLDQ